MVEDLSYPPEGEALYTHWTGLTPAEEPNVRILTDQSLVLYKSLSVGFEPTTSALRAVLYPVELTKTYNYCLVPLIR